MTNRIRGTSARPRVALLGTFSDEETTRYKEVFPTIWSASTIIELDRIVDVKEIDLLIISRGVEAVRHANVPPWTDFVHVICFSENFGESLPGPISGSWVSLGGPIRSEEFVIPDLPLPLSRRLNTDLAKLTSLRDWPKLVIHCNASKDTQLAKDTLKESAIIMSRHDEVSLAVIYQRIDSKLGVAWLPHAIFDQPAWVELISLQWAQTDRERFPDFGDWEKSPEWMLPQEKEILDRIVALENEKKETMARIDNEIGELSADLGRATVDANKGLRRLLTKQGNELVAQVVTALSEIGFQVELIDEHIDQSSPKREDLRVRDTREKHKSWKAIVEIRGYEKSSGKTADLTRLARFANLYMNEKGRLPDKRIYIVNGQIELPPSQRQGPFESSEEDLQEFAKQDGIVISTIDLFKTMKGLRRLDKEKVADSIKKATGLWTYELVLKTE